MPELVINGKIYKSVSPLYQINTSKLKKLLRSSANQTAEYIFSKRELYDLYNTLIIENVDILIPDNNSDDIDYYIQLSKKEKRVWLQSLESYTEKLDNLAKRSAGDPYILEHICYYMVISGGDINRFVELVKDKYSELEYDAEQKSLFGSVEGSSISLILDNLFVMMAKKFIALIATMPSIFIKIKNIYDTTDSYTEMTIAAFLYNMQSTYKIEIEKRLKGLGEAEPKILFPTTLNPKLRRIIRLQINDMNQCIETMKILHDKSGDMSEIRREMLNSAEISMMDLDN